MPSLYDPSRRRIGDTPMLNTKRPVAAPRLYIWPKEKVGVVVSVMVPADDEAGFVSRQVSATVQLEILPNLVAAYRADPELFLQDFFHISLELREKAKQPATSSSSEGI